MSRGCSDRNGAGAATSGNPATPCAGTAEECPYRPSIVGRFNPTEIKCGSNVELQAEATNIDDGANVSFSLRKLPDNQNIASESTPLRSSQVRGLDWVSQKPADNWPDWEIGFEVSCSGASSDSENQLKFHRYPNQAREAQTIARTSGGSTLRSGKFDIVFEDGILVVTIKIKLINRLGPKPGGGDPLPEIGDPVTEADKEEMRQDIEGKLSAKRLLHRQECARDEGCNCPNTRKCCKFKIQIRVCFVEEGEHHSVNLFQGAGRANSVNWTRIKTRDNSWAHETGHLLGWFDEYSGTTTPGDPPRWQVPREGVIMNTGLEVPAEYYWDFRDWHAGKTGERWELLSP